MKVFFNDVVKYEPYGGGIHVLAGLLEYLEEKGHKITFKLKKDIDLIFILSNSRVGYNKKTLPLFDFKKKHPNVKVIQRINVSDISKNITHANDLVFKSNSIADETVFISKWLAKYYIENGFDRPYHVIYNGCNQNYFYPEEEKELGDIINLVTHHWSDNWMKGHDIYKELDKILEKRNDLNFTYVGNYYKGYQPKNIKIIPPLYGEKLGDELRKHDIYLTAARWEACGMHHIEGACCGLPILYHKEGGGINEVCKHYGIEYYDIPTLLDSIEKMKTYYKELRKKICYEFLDIKRCCEEYYKVILSMFN